MTIEWPDLRDVTAVDAELRRVRQIIGTQAPVVPIGYDAPRMLWWLIGRLPTPGGQ
jgi:hypothetical protein